MRMEFKHLSFEIVENLTNIKPRMDINKAIVCCVTNDFPREVRNTISEHFRGGTEVVSDIWAVKLQFSVCESLNINQIFVKETGVT